MKRKYKVNCYIGVPVVTDRNGHYVIKHDVRGTYKLNRWRTGRHTNGHFQRPGQVFLTENNIRVAVIEFYPVKYNRRHRYTPLQRFTTSFISSCLLKEILKNKRP